MRKALFAAIGALILSGCAAGPGGSGGPEPTLTLPPEADRLVAITMRDNRFEPDELDVEAGETIAFAFHNAGAHPHDAFIGDADAQAEHQHEMRDGEGHGAHGGDDPNAVTVDPGERGMLVHTFDEAGIFEIGCHQPGHYAVGMIVEIEVA